jgi:DDE superfamily endonuclease
MQGAMFWMTYDGSMNSALFTEFLGLLIHDIEGKIFLIVDNVKYHSSKETSEWVKEHKDRIELFFLPSYSPGPESGRVGVESAPRTRGGRREVEQGGCFAMLCR